jgi:hypothetical protein
LDLLTPFPAGRNFPIAFDALSKVTPTRQSSITLLALRSDLAIGRLYTARRFSDSRLVLLPANDTFTCSTFLDANMSTDAPEADELFHERHPRLSTPTPVRIASAGAMAFIVGMGLGVAHGGKMAELRFRAEHAHKLPTTTPGWYLYHKSKNYHTAYGGLREGLRTGPKLAFWVMIALGLESALDSSRNRTDLLSTVLASLTAAGSFSLWSELMNFRDFLCRMGVLNSSIDRFSLSTSARVAKAGLLFGLGYGGLQDAIALFHGRPIGYVEFLRNQFRSTKSQSQPLDESP